MQWNEKYESYKKGIEKSIEDIDSMSSVNNCLMRQIKPGHKYTFFGIASDFKVIRLKNKACSIIVSCMLFNSIGEPRLVAFFCRNDYNIPDLNLGNVIFFVEKSRVTHYQYYIAVTKFSKWAAFSLGGDRMMQTNGIAIKPTILKVVHNIACRFNKKSLTEILKEAKMLDCYSKKRIVEDNLHNCSKIRNFRNNLFYASEPYLFTK
jgi:hypothetical protein